MRRTAVRMCQTVVRVFAVVRVFVFVSVLVRMKMCSVVVSVRRCGFPTHCAEQTVFEKRKSDKENQQSRNKTQKRHHLFGQNIIGSENRD